MIYLFEKRREESDVSRGQIMSYYLLVDCTAERERERGSHEANINVVKNDMTVGQKAVN